MESLSESLPVEGSFTGSLVFLGISLGAALVYALVWCRIYAKAGYPSAMGLLQLVPVVNLVMLVALAFSRWPLERDHRDLKKVQKAAHKVDEKIYSRAA